MNNYRSSIESNNEDYNTNIHSIIIKFHVRYNIEFDKRHIEICQGVSKYK